MTPVASSNTTAQNGTTTPTVAPSNQVARVQALPGNTAPPNPHKYLIETNPVLTDLRQFMSSDYLLAGLGYDPEASAKRLGDGLYEQRLVQQAIVARTGQAFLAGQTSNEAQLKYLMNNAIASKEQLNLTIGVTLSPPQVAALTHDIVWLEEHEVNGEKVLVPVLYLAQANNRLAPNGALIAGNDVTLTAGGNLDNVGTLRATNNLSATAGNDLVNTGLIEAGNRLDLLAGNDLINKAGGILYGRDVTLTATRGDVINERTVTRAVGAEGYQDFADSAARIESINDMTVKAGRDMQNIGGTLQTGRDLSLIAGRDLNIGATQIETAKVQGANTQSSITQLGSSVSVGRDLMAISGRDINVVASDIDAKRDIAMAATENMTISSAADETHSLSRSKKLTVQTDHVKQVSADLNAGGSIALNAGQDLAVISSRITAGENASLSAGENLSILAAQDSDYYLYDKKSKGSWGKKKAKRDEVTDIRNVGSEITSGGDLTLESGGDQLYQVAKLTSGNDLTIESGGGITFEGVKDFHDESHTKSKSSLAWNSMKGKGRTDETLRQTEMAAKGELTIQAVEGLRIDIKQVDQQTVSQTIDAMVQADPQLAWLKEAEKRGDVDWRQVKEIHESFKYNNSGLGPAAQIVVAILLAAVMGPAGLGLTGMNLAVATSVATTATNSAISNKGDLGAVFKDVTSSDAMKGYVLSGVMAGFVPTIDPMALNFDLAGLATVSQHVITEAALKTAIMGGSLKDNLGSAALGAGISIGGALAAKKIGDFTMFEGKVTKVVMHAALGGLMAEAMGGDFRSGALAAGANEMVVEYLAEKLLPTNVDPNSDAYKIGVSKLLTASELIGALTAAAAGGDASVGADVAANGTRYNYLEHSENEAFIKDMLGCDTDKCAKEKWELGGFDQDSQGNIEYANDVAGSMRARDARDRVMDKLDSILDMNCPTSACEGYKQLLVQRSLDTLEHLNGVIKDWATLDNYLGLMHGAAVGAQRGAILAASPAESLALIRAQKALDYLSGAKAKGGAVELTFDKATRTWTTPAGLDYGQGSVQGNRVLHVLEHAKPNPAKTTHSVFSMDRKEILGAVDEAWLKKGSPVIGDPGAYVVPMGRAIGTSGETSIKIIVRPGTNQVITAYPVK
ncbi:DUF637 domain-containing protein [Pseudomonas cichorii]|nr:DUF637 domain-containing protein [Pseudomonas cichorii]